MEEALPDVLFWTGVAQLAVLVASALVPSTLEWRRHLAPLPRLLRQMYVVYAGYVVLAIVAFAAISIAFPEQLADGSGLSRAVCGYVAVFWGVRLALQAVFDVKEHLRTWRLRAGYHALTVLFVAFTGVYGYATVR